MKNDQQTSYLENFELDFEKIEKEHFWYRARERAIRSYLGRLAKSGRVVRAVEMGAGAGGSIALLQECSREVLAVEPHPANCVKLKQRFPGLLVENENAELFFSQNSAAFDLVAAFDVLEHIEDDQKVLERVASSLRPHGSLILTVPAGKWLWSSFDQFDLHYRRYSRKDLASALELAGFRIERINYLFCSISPIVYLVRKIRDLFGLSEKQQNQDVINPPGRLVSWVLETILALEFRVSQYVPLPWGSSLICLAQKK